jgi:hypothetical protein
MAMSGYVRGYNGEPEAGFADGVHGLEISLPTGAQTPSPFIFGLMAELLFDAGQADDALSLLDIGLAMAEQNEEGMSIPDLHRRRGVILLALGYAWAEADSHFRKAVATAHRQQARLHELRALTTRLRLARIHAPAEVAAAFEQLQRACTWFGGGVDAPDLAAARTELARS